MKIRSIFKKIKTFNKTFYIISFTVLFVSLISIYLFTKSPPHTNDKELTSLFGSTSQIPISPSPADKNSTNIPSASLIEYKNVQAYGVEITETQMEVVIKYMKAQTVPNDKPPSEYFDKNDKWYFIEGYQSQELYVKNPYICELVLLWCGTLNTNDLQKVNDEKKRCLTYDIDYNNVSEWINSNTGLCCKGLIDNVDYILSCAKTDRKQIRPLNEELLFTYQLLKDSGADCKDYNCPSAIEKEIEYY